MSPEIGHDESHIFALMLTPEKRVLYESERRMLYVNMMKVISLTKTQNVIFSQLLSHPNQMQPFQKLFLLIHPNCPKPMYRLELLGFLRPPLCDLRWRLEKIDKELKGIIWTKRGEGLTYIPHCTMQSNPVISP